MIVEDLDTFKDEEFNQQLSAATANNPTFLSLHSSSSIQVDNFVEDIAEESMYCPSSHHSQTPLPPSTEDTVQVELTPVQEFHLEEDYDYENVPHTPKYSASVEKKLNLPTITIKNKLNH
eukprot:TRINITY_DN12231_c0_g1_i1.p1 TRINITY_DN12231_c0_g1~~TRINITY_DN12231_c0_g1_i1.p1  ORF type:complete len:120 (-),score=36.91 TRINITY_DN12231_c0_g1_i1:16-375(-)